MQKKLIALAIASIVAAPAFAQSSNVVMYGVVDVGVEVGNSGNGTKTRIQSGQSAGNRLGFKGEEALGSGLTAFFTLETGFSLDNGQTTTNSSLQSAGNGTGVQTSTSGSALFQRQAVAGLKGSWGQLSAGRQYTPAYLMTKAIDPFDAGLGGRISNALSGMSAYGDRYDNSVLYVTPDMSGFKLSAMYSTGSENNTNDSTENDGKSWTIAGQYANGPAFVGLSYQDHRKNSNVLVFNPLAPLAPLVVPVDSQSDSWLLVGSWDFNVVKVSALYADGNTDINNLNGAVGDNSDTNQKRWALGLTAPIGSAAKVNLTYGHRNDDATSNVAGVVNSGDIDSRFWSLGGEYALSKRTALYAAYTKNDNEDASFPINSAVNSGLNPVTSASGAPFSSYDPYAVQFGLRHSF